jgi:hypothetical protein
MRVIEITASSRQKHHSRQLTGEGAELLIQPSRYIMLLHLHAYQQPKKCLAVWYHS